MIVSAQTLAMLELSFLKGVGPATLKKLALSLDFQRLGTDQYSQLSAQVANALKDSAAWDTAVTLAAQQVKFAEKFNARIISALDTEYPQLLSQTKEDPFILFVQGHFFHQPAQSVAVIGTREPTSHGIQVAERITKYLVENEQSIVSGLAFGCDAIAHRTALKYNGHTVAVLAHGLQMTSPAAHRDLAKEILAKGGALITEYRFGQGVQKVQYVKRDRIQAGLAHSVVMVQSDLIGGSLHASRAAISYGRRLAVPRPTRRDRAYGEAKIQANVMLAEGNDQDKARLLRCSEQELASLLILDTRKDYFQLLSPYDPNEARSRSFTLEDRSDSEGIGTFGEQEEVFIAPEDFVWARRKYVSFKLRELEALVDCLPDASDESRLEAQFELESLFSQSASLISDIKILIEARDLKNSEIIISSDEIVQLCEKFFSQRRDRAVPAFAEATETGKVSWGFQLFEDFRSAFNRLSTALSHLTQF